MSDRIWFNATQLNVPLIDVPPVASFNLKGIAPILKHSVSKFYSDEELSTLEVYDYRRPYADFDTQIGAATRSHLHEPMLRSVPFGEWWRLSADLGFKLTVGDLPFMIEPDSLVKVYTQKNLGGIVQRSGCGAYPNFFEDPYYTFGLHPTKMDPAVIDWAIHTSVDILGIYKATGQVPLDDPQTWGRSLYRAAVSRHPSLRFVVDYSYPMNGIRSIVHLPLIRAMQKNCNSSFLGGDILFCWPEFRADFMNCTHIITRDLVGCDLHMNHWFLKPFYERLLDHYNPRKIRRWFGTEPIHFFELAEKLPIVYPDGTTWHYEYQFGQSGGIGLQPWETWMCNTILSGKELLYMRNTGTCEWTRGKGLADDSISGGDWNDLKLENDCALTSAKRMGHEFKEPIYGTSMSCTAMGYTVDGTGSSLPEGQLLGALWNPEHTIYCRDFDDPVERRKYNDLMSSRAMGYKLISRGIYPKFTAVCEDIIHRFGLPGNWSDLLARADDFRHLNMSDFETVEIGARFHNRYRKSLDVNKVFTEGDLGDRVRKFVEY